MCGIAGACGYEPAVASRAVEAMCDRMIARGPDDHGVVAFSSPADGSSIVLGNRRLAIIDPSAAGHQPMVDPSRGTALVYNGMVYNYRVLRRELEAEGEQFASGCDTEVVLRAYGCWGRRAIERLEGMFALAIWDPREDVVVLARDRLGIKPLYYSTRGRRLLFASQVKALLGSGLVPFRLSAEGVASYLAYGAVSEPLTVAEDIATLPPGHFAVLADGGLRTYRYWSPAAETDEPVARGDAVAELRHRLDHSIREHLLSDAPLGIFLSGGVDSTVVAGLADSFDQDLLTLSVLFDEKDYSEGAYIDQATSRLRGRHATIVLQPQHLLETLPQAFAAMDQPTFDGVNTFVVASVAAEQGLKVALSGLGADELFDGYGYVARTRQLERARRLAYPLRRMIGVSAVSITGGRRDKLAHWLSSRSIPGSSYEMMRRLFLVDDVDALCRRTPDLMRPPLVDDTQSLSWQLSVLDLAHYTRNVLLRDTDAMSMAHSVEVRVPFLDSRLVDWVLALPEPLRRDRKRLLVDAAVDLIPPGIASRKKHGFMLPLARWMRGELHAPIVGTLEQPHPSIAELVDRRVAIDVWNEYSAGLRSWLEPWALYALYKWVETAGEVAA